MMITGNLSPCLYLFHHIFSRCPVEYGDRVAEWMSGIYHTVICYFPGTMVLISRVQATVAKGHLNMKIALE